MWITCFFQFYIPGCVQPQQKPVIACTVSDREQKSSRSAASCASQRQRKLLHKEAWGLNFSACAFLLPFRSYSMEPGPSLIQPSHIRAAEWGSDHIWTLLPALDKDFGSQNKGPHGAMCVQEKDTPKSTKVCNPAVQPQPLPSSHIFRYLSVLPNP